ncbi:DinB family protein [Paenibacillus glacialis]|uniref:Damage-inducible protein DinB n=1 Tax=Paenibacillus glacialis TaxID=494026 RepID=A0A168LQR6_9BACL|nr:DinB family protein [Paenibacillus glacialis]OAB43720.1 damage-inducible protein DinB [Paenibacillus glacialis]
MKSLITYNREVRDEWFEVLNNLSTEELSKERKSGVGSILRTLFHIIDTEYSWFRAMYNKNDIQIYFEEFNDLQSIKELSNQYRKEISVFLRQWTPSDENEVVKPSWMTETYKKGEILRHIIAHEIHHIGQLSVWSRESEIEPVSSNFIGRNIKT